MHTTQADTADQSLKAKIDQALEIALDCRAQVAHAQALDFALHAALQAAQGVMDAGKPRRAALISAARMLSEAVPGCPAYRTAVSSSALVDGSVILSSRTMTLLVAIGKALGQHIPLNLTGIDPDRPIADLVGDTEPLRARVSTWTPEFARAAVPTKG